MAAGFPARSAAHHWRAGACGLPAEAPLRAEYAEIAVSPMILNEIFGPARPPLVLATSGANLPSRLRALGAHTIYWQMKIQRLLGGPVTPADPASVEAAADRLYDRAVRATACSTPLIALNELGGSWLPTPWLQPYAEYRSNALQLLRRLHALGAHPYLMVITSPRPYTGSPQAVEWWREAARVSDLVLQVHFDGRSISREGPLLGSRRRRMRVRSVLQQFVDIGIPPERLGLLHGFQSGRGFGGREGLPLEKWLRVVKWEVLAGEQVLAERGEDGAQIGSQWSWGWGDYPTLSRVDPDKHVTACVFLWARDPALCGGPARAALAGVSFNRSRSEGQIALPPGVHCSVGSTPAIASETLEQLAAVTGPRRLLGRAAAGSLLFQWFVVARTVGIPADDVIRAEGRLIEARFGGNRAAYEAALIASRMPPSLARAVIADQLRRLELARKLPPGSRFSSWARAKQSRLLERMTCRRDELPAPRLVDVAEYVPYLRLTGPTANRPAETRRSDLENRFGALVAAVGAALHDLG